MDGRDRAGLPAQIDGRAAVALVRPLYGVLFAQRDVWPGYTGPGEDTLVVDVYEHWLEEA